MSAHWRQRPEGGSRLGIWLVRGIALYGGRPLARLLLYPVTLYFYMRRGPERAASRHYLSRLQGRPAGVWQVLRHFHCFAATVLDRVFLLARGERDFDIRVDGLEVLQDALAQGRGVLLLGAHLGSFEALRTLASRCPEVPLRVVLDKQQSPRVTQMLEALAPEIAAGVIDGAGDAASVVLALAEAARQGHMIALLADRGRPGEPMRQAPFLDAPAPFPVGPWQLAHALGLPVLLCFGLYEGGRRYTLHFEAFANTLAGSRQAREAAVQACIEAYARRLQARLLDAPYNWFNFYDFWDDRSVGGIGAGADARFGSDARA